MLLLFIQLAAHITEKSPALIEEAPSWQPILKSRPEQIEWGLYRLTSIL